MSAGKFLKTGNNDVKFPQRATSGSAGYDFYAPEELCIEPHKSVMFDTGIIADINPGWVLMLFPRSGLGMKGIRIANTVGVIDSDYKLEIKCKLVNDSDNTIIIGKGDRFGQGVFVPFGIVDNDSPRVGERLGGMGSTGN